MKLTKRIKNSIIQGVIINIFFLFILTGGVLLFLYPRITVIENKKSDLLETYSKFQDVTVQGVSFWDFKTSITQSEFSKDSYTLNLIRNVTQEFYNKNFTNTGSQTYNAFLDGLKQEVSLKQSSDEYIQKDQTLSTILPIYDEKNIFSDEWLSDFFFTNYIENIMYTFNLSSKGEIWIWDIQKQGKSDKKNEQKDSLQQDIYSIPLVFDIEGQKRDVVDFIHYFENVGGIYIQGDRLNIYKDTFINKRLEGTEWELEYNIYKNQIADINTLSLQKYPDSSSLKTQGLVSAMKWPQGREKINMEIELSFYVAWVPWYKMEEYIEDFLISYQNLSSDISLNSKKYTSQAYKFNSGEALLSIKNLQSLDSVMLALSDEIIIVRAGLASKKNIKEVYERVVIYQDQVSKIKASYNKQLSILTQ
jgi:hypothetical protein